LSEHSSPTEPAAYSRRQAWAWIPSLYFTEGLPNVVVATVSVLLYKSFEVPIAAITFYTGLLYLPWVIKPLWSPFVDNLSTKRRWTLSMQFLLSLGMLGVAGSLSSGYFFVISLVLFWLMAFWSATHDIAADGFYMLAIPESDQAWFVGIRSTSYRLATVAVNGPVLILIGVLQHYVEIPTSWLIGFFGLGAVLLLVTLYHAIVLPRPAQDAIRMPANSLQLLGSFWQTFRSFFVKPGIRTAVAFLLFYRFAEAQLATVIKLFLVDSQTNGGLGLTMEQYGLYYGTIGVGCLLAGGILGGMLASRDGLRHWLWWMVAVINIPNVVYVLLSQVQPTNSLLISACIAVETFGYGFGFTAYMLYMLYLARGEHETAHYAICTGFMALGLMIPAMFSGKLQEIMGYEWFFIWVMLATIPSFVVCGLINIDPSFGRKAAAGLEEPTP
jgi:MFS transporter, PAT family, beta-lactamase induction signal transducer AmpG